MKRHEALYRAAGPALLRAAASRYSDVPTRWPDLENAEDCRRWLIWVWPEAREAISLASTALAARVDQIVAGNKVSDRQLSSASGTVTRYLLRSGGRPTPFALFAGVAPASFTTDPSEVKARMGGKGRASVRADAAWLEDVITDLERGDLLEHAEVVFSTLAMRRGGRLTVSRAEGRAEIDYTDPVRVIAEAVTKPIVFADLAAVLAAKFPAVAASRINAMLSELVEQRFLLTSLRAPMTDTDPLGHLIKAVKAASASGNEHTMSRLNQLEDVYAAIGMLDQVDEQIQPQRDPLPALVRAMNTISPAARSPLCVDLALDAHVCLPTTVAKDAADAAEVLIRLGPEPLGPPVWADYHRRFVERYGVGTVVPLLEVLDGASGLGYPAGYPRSLLPKPPEVVSERERRLLSLAWKALHVGGVLELDDELIRHITEDDKFDREFVPPHLEIAARIRARNLHDLAEGRYTLAITPARAVGTLTSRFWQLTRDKQMSKVYETVPTTHDGALPVQLSCPPRFVRGQNVARHATFLPNVLAIGEPPQDTDASVMYPADLALTATGRGLLLIERSSGRVLDPQVYHALALERQMPPLARFLAHLPRAYAASLSSFDFGPAASHLSHLPEVRYGRLTLASERWRLVGTELPGLAESATAWRQELDRWRGMFGCPEVVELADGDMTLHLDLGVAAHAAILREHLADQPAILFRAPEPDAYGWIGHAHEVVVPVFRAGRGAPTKLTGLLTRRANADGHRPADPASGWISARIHTDPDCMDELIGMQLPSLIRALPGVPLWLVRYRNTEQTDHLRIRVATGTGEYTEARTAALGIWAADLLQLGIAGPAVLDTYFPEVGRYGFAEAMAAAETAFCADTACAMTVLGQPPELPSEAVTALSMLDIAEAFLGGMDAAADYFAARILSQRQTIARPTAAQACTVARLGVPRRQAVQLGVPIAAAWVARAEALVAYRASLGMGMDPARVLDSLLHLHFNRHRGIDRIAEASCVRLARSAALAWRVAQRGRM